MSPSPARPPRVARAATMWTAYLAAGLLLLAGGFAGPAVAATKAHVTPELQVELWPDHDKDLTTVIVLAKLPDSVKLPATVLLPIPETAQLTWTGEINEAAPSGDTTLPSTIVRPGEGFNIGRAVQITAKDSHLVQYEAIVGPVTRQDGRVTAKLDWRQSAPAKTVTFSTRVPIDATDVVIDPAPAGPPQEDSSLGQKLYTLEPATIAVGRKYPFTVAYTKVGGGSRSNGAAGGTADASAGLPWLVGLVGAVIVVMILVMLNARKKRGATMEDHPR